MTKLNSFFILIGLAFLACGVLLLIFPDVMKYIFSAAAIACGIALLAIVWNGRKGR